MPYEREGKCVYKKDGERRTLVKCHDSVKKAEAHLAALHINVEAEEKQGEAGYAYLSLADHPSLQRLTRQMQDALPDTDVDWVDPATWHVTLVYAPAIGDRQLIRAAREIRMPGALALTSQGLGIFENGGERVLVLLLQRSEALTRLQDSTYYGFRYAWGEEMAVDHRADIPLSPYSEPSVWQPHITLAALPPGAGLPAVNPVLSLIADTVVVARDDYQTVAEISGPRFAPEAGVQVLKARDEDGRRLMVIVTSNAYKDREDEIIPEAALAADVDRRWQGDAFVDGDPLLLWHAGEPIGDIVFADMEGAFLLEVARERDPEQMVDLAAEGEPPLRVPVGTVWDVVEQGDEEWAASHRFLYARREAGVYGPIRKNETSVLPHWAAANPWTYSGIIHKELEMANKQRRGFLGKMFGPEMEEQVDATRAAVRQAQEELDGMGVERKDADAVKAFVAGIRQQFGEDVELPETFDEVIAKAYEAAAVNTAETPTGGEDVGLQKKAVAAMQDYVADVTKDVGEIARGQVQIVEAVKGVKDDTAAAMKALTDRIEALEKQLAGRPRRATAAIETLLNGDDPMAADIQARKAREDAPAAFGDLFDEPAGSNGQA